MNRFVVGTLGVGTLVLLGVGSASAQERTFTGLITDEQLNCIQSPMKVPQPTTQPAPPPEGRGGGRGGCGPATAGLGKRRVRFVLGAQSRPKREDRLVRS